MIHSAHDDTFVITDREREEWMALYNELLTIKTADLLEADIDTIGMGLMQLYVFSFGQLSTANS